jgi:hypothetical protein
MPAKYPGVQAVRLTMGAALVLAVMSEGHAPAQVAEPASPGPRIQTPHHRAPATPELREIESLRREVAELQEQVRKMQEELVAREKLSPPTIELLPIRPAVMIPKERRGELIPEGPRGHLLFPIHIERANYPAPRSLRKQIDDAAPPRKVIRPFPMRP